MELLSDRTDPWVSALMFKYLACLTTSFSSSSFCSVLTSSLEGGLVLICLKNCLPSLSHCMRGNMEVRSSEWRQRYHRWRGGSRSCWFCVWRARCSRRGLILGEVGTGRESIWEACSFFKYEVIQFLDWETGKMDYLRGRREWKDICLENWLILMLIYL